jgi:thiamine biosynthesis lipoprotein
MGSFCEIQFVDTSRIDARKRLRVLLDEVARLEIRYSRYRDDSLVSAINATAGTGKTVAIDPETRALLDHAFSCYEQSGGLFDITSGVLRRIWDFKSGVVPSQADIDALLPSIGMERLDWTGDRMSLPAGMEIDFGGIVKEYAADCTANLARRIGITSGLVNLGGDFAVIGPLPDGKPWPVGIVHPSRPEALMARLHLNAGGLASSGDYERFFEHQGKRYSHLLNARTGWPSEGLRAVSVCAELCTVAGSAATIAMLKPAAEAITWLADLGLPHVYMQQDGSIGSPDFQPPENITT